MQFRISSASLIGVFVQSYRAVGESFVVRSSVIIIFCHFLRFITFNFHFSRIYSPFRLNFAFLVILVASIFEIFNVFTLIENENSLVRRVSDELVSVIEFFSDVRPSRVSCSFMDRNIYQILHGRLK